MAPPPPFPTGIGFPLLQQTPVGCYYFALDTTDLANPASFILRDDQGTTPLFFAVVRHVVTGMVVKRQLAVLGELEITLNLQRPQQLNYLADYWTRVDECCVGGTLQP